MNDSPGPPPHRRLIYLSLATLLVAILLASRLWPGAGSTAGPGCDAGTAIYRMSVERDSQGGSHLLALVGPASGLNAVVGNAPGCQALLQSDDAGATWTAVFSHSSEGPVVVDGDASGRRYVLATTIRFPLYLAGNIYRNDDPRFPWFWQRVSPQQRSAIPSVAITAMAVAPDYSLIALAASGDGGALIRSTDYGLTWQPIVVPAFPSVSGMAVLGDTIAVVPASYTPGTAPGRTSTVGGRTWALMGALPNPPQRADLKPVLSTLPAEDALVLNLVIGSSAVRSVSAAAYFSRDGGRTWRPVHCGAQPSAGCAAVDLWSQTSRARYVLYRGRLFRSVDGQSWRPMATTLPGDADSAEQVVAAAQGQDDVIYLVTRNAIWRLDSNRAWSAITGGLTLLAPASPAYTSLPPGWPAIT
jgi:photosystem II stability/assembly factor-like uncharacterized protein